MVEGEPEAWPAGGGAIEGQVGGVVSPGDAVVRQ